MNTVKIAIAATAAALILLASCGGKKAPKDELSAQMPGSQFNPDIAYSSFIDERDGKKYRAVKIGEQTWMAENLNFETGNSGCYDDNENFCLRYGRLYDWSTAMKACPAGWRLPDTTDWNDLVQAVGRDSASNRLKSKTGWGRDGNGTDEFGFSALPNSRAVTFGKHDKISGNSYWWSATVDSAGTARLQTMDLDSGHMIGIAHLRLIDSKTERVCELTGNMTNKVSVRCLQE